MSVAFDRDTMIARLESESRRWDIIIIGGGATGLGCAVESAARGYQTLLLEAGDFARGTSSRSTKLVHGGVRYLRRGNISLVLEALKMEIEVTSPVEGTVTRLVVGANTTVVAGDVLVAVA